MNKLNQSQKSGDNSSLVQAEVINNYYGITEARAREIIKESLPDILREYSNEAQETAEKRIAKFADNYIDRLVRENLLEKLRDPGIQIQLKEAEKAAASSGRDNDINLLSDLLIQRTKFNENSTVKLGVSYAIDILDKISDDSLIGLTIAHFVYSFVPHALDIKSCLEILDNSLSKILYMPLPDDTLWIDQLDVVKAIRIIPFTKHRSFENQYIESLPNHFDIGIKKGSKDFYKAIDILTNANIPLVFLSDNELLDNYVRFIISDIERLDECKITIDSMCLSQSQKDAINQVLSLYSQDEALKKEIANNFVGLINKYEHVSIVRNWWNSVNIAFNLTSVGRVLAHTNALRCDASIPPINEMLEFIKHIEG